MGIFNRLKNITFFAQAPPKEKDEPKIPLRWEEQDRWDEQLAAHTGVAGTYAAFAASVAHAREQLEHAAKAFTNEASLRQIPERARTTNAVHGSEYAKQLRKLAGAAQFTSVYTFEQERERFQEALDAFWEGTKKSAAALGEFLGKELAASHGLVQQLDDAVLAFLQVMEERGGEALVRLKQAQDELRAFEREQGKYRELMDALGKELEATKAKREKIDAKIREQRTLIRNPQALEALDRLANVEAELDKIAAPFESACADLKRLYAKHPQLAAGNDMQRMVNELPRSPVRFIAENAALAQSVCEAAAAQIEDESLGRTGNLASRLRACGQSVAKDAVRIGELVPEQQRLRKDVIRDIAALNIYDQQQFLLRAGREEAEATAKLTYVREQLEGARKVALEREMQDAALALGASVPERQAASADVPVGEEVDDALEHAQEEISYEEERLSGATREEDDLHEAQRNARESIGGAEALLRDVDDELRGKRRA
jgi:hypothetical protein